MFLGAHSSVHPPRRLSPFASVVVVRQGVESGRHDGRTCPYLAKRVLDLGFASTMECSSAHPLDKKVPSNTEDRDCALRAVNEKQARILVAPSVYLCRYSLIPDAQQRY